MVDTTDVDTDGVADGDVAHPTSRATIRTAANILMRWP
jgi:hypothetical protein